MDLTFLQKNYLLVPLSVIVYFISMNILNSVNKKEKNYTVDSIIVGLIVTFIVYLHNIIPVIEEVITSPPPF